MKFLFVLQVTLGDANNQSAFIQNVRLKYNIFNDKTFGYKPLAHVYRQSYNRHCFISSALPEVAYLF